jgi:hypothetical protein
MRKILWFGGPAPGRPVAAFYSSQPGNVNGIFLSRTSCSGCPRLGSQNLGLPVRLFFLALMLGAQLRIPPLPACGGQAQIARTGHPLGMLASDTPRTVA